MTRTAQLGAHTVELTNLDKILFPDSGITKGDVIEHYRRVAPHALTHIERRPLTLQRFPNGIGEGGFYQKEIPDHYPPWVPTVSVTLEDGGRQKQATADNAATLTFLAQQGTITLHVWTSRAPKWTRPDRIVFDLDPGEATTFDVIRATARELRRRLDAIGLTGFPMLTGSRGVHVWVPIRRGPGFDPVRTLARTIAANLVADAPSELTSEIRKAARGGRLFLDVGRNAKGQTAVAPYSLRARPDAPVATPVAWDELDDVDDAATYTLRSLPGRLERVGDPWRGMGRHAADVMGAAARLEHARQ